MPQWGVQRGAVSLMSWVVGDVLTPGWASTKDAKRISKDNNPGLVNIPSIPLSWGDAQNLLQSIKGFGFLCPDDYKGGVPDVEFWSGNSSSPKVHLVNDQDEVEKQPIWNVMAKIRGVEQREKSIIIGNHRDAWVYGATDPGSGTAVMLEVARVFGDLVRKGWRPLRTIEFASWDGEEYNLIGSTEYVEGNIDRLRRDAFAYLNVDVAVAGQEFRAAGSPVFRKALLRVLDRTSDLTRNATLRELWDRRGGELEGLGAGSDCKCLFSY
jgi:acetylornithine deacetylase/succinyl-diaminopimelate desuccinylase-like protein